LIENNTALAGHANMKQKIQMHYKLQKENVALKNQKLALQEQLEKTKLEKARIEKQLEKYIAIANQVLPVSNNTARKLTSSTEINKQTVHKPVANKENVSDNSTPTIYNN
jgi:hypothetical protein